jgi:hypothetical protein
MIGPGKYDSLCTWVRAKAQASTVILLVIDGSLGTGFSIQSREDIGHALPGILRQPLQRARPGTHGQEPASLYAR